jgi:hypothetical protein
MEHEIEGMLSMLLQSGPISQFQSLKDDFCENIDTLNGCTPEEKNVEDDVRSLASIDGPITEDWLREYFRLLSTMKK